MDLKELAEMVEFYLETHTTADCIRHFTESNGIDLLKQVIPLLTRGNQIAMLIALYGDRNPKEKQTLERLDNE